jgi:hypothetical protein
MEKSEEPIGVRRITNNTFCLVLARSCSNTNGLNEQKVLFVTVNGSSDTYTT